MARERVLSFKGGRKNSCGNIYDLEEVGHWGGNGEVGGAKENLGGSEEESIRVRCICLTGKEQADCTFLVS